MSLVVEVIRLLPEIIRLVQAIRTAKGQTSQSDVKADLVALRKAIEEHDEKAISNLFASLES